MEDKNLLEGKQILIVDDEPDILDTLEELLDMCKVIKASNFDEAKELIETRYFDMIILDIMGVDGYKLLEIANQRNMITVMLTAHALTPDNMLKSFKEGAASYVPKDEMVNIAVFLNDIFEAKEAGKSFWWRWYDRLGSFFEDRFGEEWEEKRKELTGDFHI